MVAWVVRNPDDIVAWWSALDDGRRTKDEGRSWLVRRMSSLVRRRVGIVSRGWGVVPGPGDSRRFVGNMDDIVA